MLLWFLSCSFASLFDGKKGDVDTAPPLPDYDTDSADSADTGGCAGIPTGEQAYVSIEVLLPSGGSQNTANLFTMFSEYNAKSFANLRFGDRPATSSGEPSFSVTTYDPDATIRNADDPLTSIRIYITDDTTLLTQTYTQDGNVYIPSSLLDPAVTSDDNSDMTYLITALFGELGVAVGGSPNPNDATFSVTTEQSNDAYCEAKAMGLEVQ